MLKRILLIVFGIGIPLVMIVVVFLGYSWVFESNVKITKPLEFFVYPNENPRDILARLVAEDVVEDERSFILVAQQKKWLTAKPGRYMLEPGMSNNAMVNMFRGGLQTPVTLSINMAESIADVAGQASKTILADSAAIYSSFVDEDFLAKNDLDFTTVRTIVLPNTYEVYWSVTPEDLRDRLLREYKAFWTDGRKALAQGLNLTVVQVSSLASIVEKEAGANDEMPTIAGLYLNRLRKGMLLQSDPTVLYAKQLRDGKSDIQRVLYADLEIDSPYNTYRYPGLPPAPIQIPSAKAIDAVLHAEQHDYLFMCANPEKPGYHSFAKNGEQHSVNVRKWHKWLNDNKIMR
jgi:UPF0755 protein